MHAGNLAAFFHEEKTIAMEIPNSDHQLAKLKERSIEIKNNITEDITKLLLKRQTLMILKTEMGKIGQEGSIILTERKIANLLKQTIHSKWTDAINASKLI
jgi:hypothetical protein